MNLIKKLLPKSIKHSWLRNFYYSNQFTLELLKNYWYDYKRFLTYSATKDLYGSQRKHQGRILAHYHQIEKGLSFKVPRPGFGKEVVRHLVAMLEDYQNKYGLDETGHVALNVLFAYYEFNIKHGIKNEELHKKLLYIKSKISTDASEIKKEGGTINLNKEQIKADTAVNFKAFAYSRYSVRQFSETPVDNKLIEEAVSIAIKTPSVCNRQTWKVCAFSDRDKKARVLSHQNGNRGFGITASQVLIVTSDLNLFASAAERNQCFIDGGLFSMSLIYALHSLGLGTCCLNWSVKLEKDRALRKEAEISDSEAIIMLIAVGHLPDTFSVASSPRRKTEEVLVIK